MGRTRERIHQMLSELTPFDRDERADDGEDDVPSAGVLTAWVVVAEWQGDDGFRWLSKMSSDAMGDRPLPCWTERGLCNEIVNHWDE